MITIHAGLHSSEKNHKTMTGGTLTVDKRIDSSEPLQIFTYIIPLFGIPGNEIYEAFHQGMHTNEHLFAYTPDTGSLRASLTEVLPELDTKKILDVSPFQIEDGYGFRVTSLIELDQDTLTKATKISIHKASAFLRQAIEGNGDTEGFLGIPFATAEQCGQFTYHHPQQAQESLQGIHTESIKIVSHIQTTNHPKIVVCDLRLLKPKTDETDNRITLDPEFSYFLSQTIERELPMRLPGAAVVVGTFGCMTGTYLCISHEDDEEKDIPRIHAAIMTILSEIDRAPRTSDQLQQLDTILDNYKNFGKKE